MDNNRVNAASELTAFIDEQLDLVRHEIALPRKLNGYGVFRQRLDVRESLETMRRGIERAIARFDALQWPSQQDYESYDK